MLKNKPSEWGDSLHRDPSRMHWISDKSMPLAEALRNGEFDSWDLTAASAPKLAMFIMAIIREGCTDVYPSASRHGDPYEANLNIVSSSEISPHAEWLDLIYTGKEIPRCSSGSSYLNLNSRYGDETARWATYFVASFASVRQVIGKPLDMSLPTHTTHRQNISQFFNWRKLYMWWPWGYMPMVSTLSYKKGELTEPKFSDERWLEAKALYDKQGILNTREP